MRFVFEKKVAHGSPDFRKKSNFWINADIFIEKRGSCAVRSMKGEA